MSSSVFEANNLTNTGTAVPNAGGDNHAPIQGSAANWGAISSDTFLQGPKPGQEQTLVKVGNQTALVATGERKHDVEKDATTHVNSGDNKLFYHKNRDADVTLDDKLTVHGNSFLNVEKDHNVSVIRNIQEHANLKITVEAGVELVLRGPGGEIKIDSTGVTIQGVLVKIN